MDKPPTINIVHNEQLPQNRKDIIIRKDTRINDADTLDRMIYSYINFIVASKAEIPDNIGFDKDAWWKNEPTVEEMTTEFVTLYKPPFKEVVFANRNFIERMRKERYLRYLQKYVAHMHELIKTHQHWMFDEMKNLTYGK
jgi:hypothetical protein